MFTCALPPTAIAAARAALRVLGAEPERPARLQSNARLLRESLREHVVEVPAGDSPIAPVEVGEALRAVELADGLLQAGWFVPAVRPPTVPKGMACLRLTVTTEHGEAECRGVATAVGEALS